MPPAKPTETITINPKKIAVVVSLIFTLIGGGYAAFTTIDDVHGEFATKVDVSAQIKNVQSEILEVAIMGYEDSLIEFDFLIETDAATPADRVAKANVERRITDLKVKLNAL